MYRRRCSVGGFLLRLCRILCRRILSWLELYFMGQASRLALYVSMRESRMLMLCFLDCDSAKTWRVGTFVVRRFNIGCTFLLIMPDPALVADVLLFCNLARPSILDGMIVPNSSISQSGIMEGAIKQRCEFRDTLKS